MKKIIFITLLISISTVFGFAQEAKKTNSEVTGSPTSEKQKQWMVNNFRAVSEVPVTLLTPAGEKVQSGTTDKQGAFNFTNVTAGKYIVAIGKYDLSPSKGRTEYRVLTAREAGSGMATGRRQYEPLVIRKRIDKSSPLLAKKEASAVAIATPKKDDDCDDDCNGIVEVSVGFGDRVNAGLQQAGSVVSGAAGMLGGAIPGASVVSALTIHQGIEIKEPGIIGGTITMALKTKTKSNQCNERQIKDGTCGETPQNDPVKN